MITTLYDLPVASIDFKNIKVRDIIFFKSYLGNKEYFPIEIEYIWSDNGETIRVTGIVLPDHKARYREHIGRPDVLPESIDYGFIREISENSTVYMVDTNSIKSYL